MVCMGAAECWYGTLGRGDGAGGSCMSGTMCTGPLGQVRAREGRCNVTTAPWAASLSSDRFEDRPSNSMMTGYWYDNGPSKALDEFW